MSSDRRQHAYRSRLTPTGERVVRITEAQDAEFPSKRSSYEPEWYPYTLHGSLYTKLEPFHFRLIDCEAWVKNRTLDLYQFSWEPDGLPEYAVTYRFWQTEPPRHTRNRYFALKGRENVLQVSWDILWYVCAAALRENCRYLWLDPLCVMQDPEDVEWHSEWRRKSFFRYASSCIVLPTGLEYLPDLRPKLSQPLPYRRWAAAKDMLTQLSPEKVLVLHRWQPHLGAGTWRSTHHWKHDVNENATVSSPPSSRSKIKRGRDTPVKRPHTHVPQYVFGHVRTVGTDGETATSPLRALLQGDLEGMDFHNSVGSWTSDDDRPRVVLESRVILRTLLKPDPRVFRGADLGTLITAFNPKLRLHDLVELVNSPPELNSAKSHRDREEVAREHSDGRRPRPPKIQPPPPAYVAHRPSREPEYWEGERHRALVPPDRRRVFGPAAPYSMEAEEDEWDAYDAYYASRARGSPSRYESPWSPGTPPRTEYPWGSSPSSRSGYPWGPGPPPWYPYARSPVPSPFMRPYGGHDGKFPRTRYYDNEYAGSIASTSRRMRRF